MQQRRLEGEKQMSINIQIHENAPVGFNPWVEVSACYLEIEGKVLFLQRSPEKSEGGKWGVPAGKLEKGEDPQTAAQRELFEETGISVHDSPKIQYIRSLYIERAEGNFIYHMFHVELGALPQVEISDEHRAFLWASTEDLSQISLMAGADRPFITIRRD